MPDDAATPAVPRGDRTPADVPDVTLVEFFRARLDDRAARAASIHMKDCGAHVEHSWGYEFHPEWCDCEEPGRVLADVQAMRMIVDTWQTWQTNVLVDGDEHSKGYAAALDRVLRHLAQPSRRHPDYRREWSPWWG